MKRYWLFVGHHEDCDCGMHDFAGDFHTKSEARKEYYRIRKGTGEFKKYYWGQIFDTERRTIVYRNNYLSPDDREKF